MPVFKYKMFSILDGSFVWREDFRNFLWFSNLIFKLLKLQVQMLVLILCSAIVKDFFLYIWKILTVFKDLWRIMISNTLNYLNAFKNFNWISKFNIFDFL